MGDLEGMEVVVMEVEDDEQKSEEELKWENILPRMVLRVLLVEADDSTRQIIGALLRKYNYKVAAISDGLKAWEILKRRHSNIDLILTELDLPSISGYALLTLIMEHDGCKDIPVIIMSSQDSISMVLKCLLKGAADFLVKPVRKNELKNLWRHVWRRLANNAGHNPQNITAGQHKTEATIENIPSTDHSGDYVSSSWKSSGFSEKATDAQVGFTQLNIEAAHYASFTKLSQCAYMEAERACIKNLQGLPQVKNSEDTVVNHGEGQCQAKNVKGEEGLSLHANVIDDRTDGLASGVQPPKEVNVSTALVDVDGSCTGIAADDGRDGPGNHTYRADVIGHELHQPSVEAVDLIGRINKQGGTAGQASSSGELNGLSSTPALDLSLKRPLDSATKEVQERQILNHSSASAFTWYSSTKKPWTSFPSSNGELPKIKVVSDSPLLSKPSSSNWENKPNILVPQSAHCDPDSPHHQIGPVPLPGIAIDSGVWASYGAAFQPIFSPYSGPTTRSPNSALQREESPLLTSNSLHSDPGTYSSIQGCSQAGDELKTRESVERPGNSSSQVVDPSGSSTQCNDFGSGHKLSAQGSASEITDVNATASGIKGSSFVEESDGCKPYILDQFKSKMGIHSAEREAALAKFRQKRKGRCFEKKVRKDQVRYHSRKKLAEQRPRVKGQFVRQVLSDQVLVDDKP